MSIVKIPWREDMKPEIDAIKQNVELWRSNFIKWAFLVLLPSNNMFSNLSFRLQTAIKVPDSLKSLVEDIDNSEILAQSFARGTPGNQFLSMMWNEKSANATKSTVYLLNLVSFYQKQKMVYNLIQFLIHVFQIEKNIIHRFLKFQTYLGCDKQFHDVSTMCEHMKGLHLHNILGNQGAKNKKGRDFENREKELLGFKHMDCIRQLFNEGKLTEYGNFPKWMLIAPKNSSLQVESKHPS